MIHLHFIGKKSDLDPQIQSYLKRMKTRVRAVYEKQPSYSTKFIIGCDERGLTLDSIQFSKLLEKQNFNVDIVIGADDGLPKQNYNLLINLAPFVLAHDIARLVLSEQVYRAISIFEGHPYHRV